ncbi:unnamed protein product [Choristocarpus tenellus]
MVPCAQGFEHMSMAVPQTMPPEQNERTLPHGHL